MTVSQEALEELLVQGISQQAIGRKLGCSSSTVNKYVHKYGLTALAAQSRSDKLLKKPCRISECTQDEYIAELCGMHHKRFWRHGDPAISLAIKHERNSCLECGAVVKHHRSFHCSRRCVDLRNARKARESFLARLCHDSTMKSGRVKTGCFKYGLLMPICVGCKLTEWTSSFGTSSPLQLDHINGDPTDNRLENLRILCANCHTQTDTFCGRNIGNKTRKR